MSVVVLGLFTAGLVSCFQQEEVNNYRLQSVLDVELKHLMMVETYIQQTSSSLHRTERQLSKVVSAKPLNVKRRDYLNSPLSVLVMVRRLLEDWTALIGTVVGNFGLYKNVLGNIHWPNEEDLEAAAATVMRSQWTYDLDIEHLAEGIVTGRKVLTNVSAADCFNIANIYYKNNFILETWKWLQQALIKIDSGDTSISRETVMLLVTPAMCASGMSRITQTTLMELIRKHPRSKIPTNLNNDYNDIFKLGCIELVRLIEDYKEHDTYEQLSSEELSRHKRLCQGHGKQQSGLRCRYVDYQKPHLRLQPFKMEELQVDPPVMRFVNVMTDHEAKVIRSDALIHMNKASTIKENGTVAVSNYRTSLAGWLYPGMSEVSDRLTRRMSDMTQLDVWTGEVNQLSRYSISGEYLSHHDYLKYSGVPFVNDRIATLMFYLNEVEEGGNTVFLLWGLSVPPIKNSAVLWFNYLPSGEVDPNSEHSGCPVLEGTKWVLNKWFHNRGQEFRMPCGLNQDSSYSHRYFE